MATLIHLPFKNKTIFYAVNSLQYYEDEIWRYLQRTEGAPADITANFRLRLDVSSKPYRCRVECTSGLKGGKGGFGTLLKGQSKQAGAKLTTNFGACRDLSGRRLRHVNDEIRLQKWHEAKRRREAGLPVDELAEAQTSSGIHGWHLAVPAWADVPVTNKSLKASERRLKREFDAKKREEMRLKELQEQQKTIRENSVLSYANIGLDMIEKHGKNESLSFRKDDAIVKGLIAASKTNEGDSGNNSQVNKKRNMTEMSNNKISTSNKWLVSLSGDIIEGNADDIGIDNDMENDNIVYIQSRSEFASACALFTAFHNNGKWYFEVVLKTCGIAQIGWAKDGFKPDSSNGDGVGDDDCSWGFDGFRSCQFFAGESNTYGKEWACDDCLGCLYDSETGEISFQLNGDDLGIANTVRDSGSPLYPAFSLNEGEVIGIRTGPFFKYLPEGFTGINKDSSQQSDVGSSTDIEILLEEPPPPPTEDLSIRSASIPLRIHKLSAKLKERAKEINEDEIDLDKYGSVNELEELGLERLKSVLTALGVKCG